MRAKLPILSGVRCTSLMRIVNFYASAQWAWLSCDGVPAPNKACATIKKGRSGVALGVVGLEQSYIPHENSGIQMLRALKLLYFSLYLCQSF